MSNNFYSGPGRAPGRIEPGVSYRSHTAAFLTGAASSFFFLAALWFPAELQAYRQINLRGKIINISEFGAAQLSRYNVAERRVLASYLIEYAFQYHNAREQRALLGSLEEGGDQDLRTLSAIARSYFFNRSVAGRLAELSSYRNKGLNEHLLSYHIGLGQLELGQLDANLRDICQVNWDKQSCRLASFLSAMEKARQKTTISFADLKSLLLAGQFFLEGNPVYPPFFRLHGARICNDLYSLGLPLEAALLADRLSLEESDSSLKELQGRVPFYLAGAGDFYSAARFVERTHSQNSLSALARLDFLILSGHYEDALNLLASVGPDRLVRPGYIDYWTRFPVSAEGNRLKAAMLLYLSGQIREAADALEKIKNFRGKTPEGEPEALFARLRLVQIIMRDNPGLAQKIAEDVSYEAQEHGWEVLEYQATVLDGWARYFQRDYYRATINFRKAQGIIKGENRKYISNYSLLLGNLAAARAMAPRQNHRRLIEALNDRLQKNPYHEALYIMRDWLVRGLGPEFLLEQISGSQLARRNSWGALNANLEFERVEDKLFQPGRNPGGFRGFDSSVRWSHAISAMQSARSIVRQPPVLMPQVRSLALSRQASPERIHIQPHHLARSQAYLFSFSRPKGRMLALVYPEGKGHSIEFLMLGQQEERRLLQCRSTGCAGPVSGLAGRLAGVRFVKVKYTADFDPDWHSLLGLPAVYFFHATEKFGSRSFELNYMRTSSCSGPPGFNSSALSFRALAASADLKASIWLWPSGVDHREGSRGSERPVYLRNFTCGSSSLRFWDLDRFSTGAGPGLVLFSARASGEAALDQAFARHFAERRTALLELSSSWSSSDSRWLAGALQGSSPSDLIALALSAEKAGRLRLILPDMFD